MSIYRTQIPLLKDRHNHPLLYAALSEGINLSQDRSNQHLSPESLREHAIQRIRELAEQREDDWTIVFGWHSAKFTLSKADFDDLPPVVVFNISLHGLFVNDAGNEILRKSDPEIATNLANQQWVEHHLRRVLNVFAQHGATVDRLKRFFAWLHEVHGTYYAEEMLLVDAHEIELFEETGLIDRTQFWAAPELYDGLPVPIQQKIHGIKLFADGVIGMRTAALNDPYRDTKSSDERGMLVYRSSDLQEILHRYLKRGISVAVHAIGNRAIDQVVSVLDVIGQPFTRQIRIEHAQLISETTAMRAKELGVKLCMQPNFSEDSVNYAKRLPENYPRQNNPFRMLIDRAKYTPGDDLLFGSDGMPHGWQMALQESLFPQSGFVEQTLTMEEFVAGYCMPDMCVGKISVHVDIENRRVTGGIA